MKNATLQGTLYLALKRRLRNKTYLQSLWAAYTVITTVLKQYTKKDLRAYLIQVVVQPKATIHLCKDSNRNDKPSNWSTKVVSFKTTKTCKIQFILPAFYEKYNISWTAFVDNTDKLTS